MKADAGWAIAGHSHGQYEMLVLYAGRHQAVIQGRNYVQQAGDVLLYPPGCVHAEAVLADGTDWGWVGFEWPGTKDRQPERFVDMSGRARVILEWLLDEQRDRSPTRARVYDALFTTLLAHLLEAPRAERSELVRRTRAFFRQHLGEPLNLAATARYVHLSKFHFVRVYRGRTGHTPMADLRMLRLDRARELLLTTDLPLKAIAPQCGLGDEHALSRLFRRYLGAPPSRFRTRSGSR